MEMAMAAASSIIRKKVLEALDIIFKYTVTEINTYLKIHTYIDEHKPFIKYC
jgi:GMP synthase PP-ATPase subunit